MIDLVVMRLENMHRMHPKQDNSRLCALCGKRVGIYPSGQALLAAHPDARIVCSVCTKDQPPPVFEGFATGNAEDMIRESRESFDVKGRA